MAEIDRLVAQLGSNEDGQPEASLKQLAHRLMCNYCYKSIAVYAGAVPAIVKLAKSGIDQVAMHAASVLHSIAWGDDACKQAIADTEGAVAALGRLMASTNVRTAKDAAGVLAKICCGPIGRRQGVVELAKRMLVSERGNETQTAALLCTIVSAACPEGRQALLDADVLPDLVRLLASYQGREAECAAETLYHIATGDDACKQAIAGTEGAVAALGRLMASHKEQEAERASQALRKVAWGNDACKQAIISAPGVISALCWLMTSMKGRLVEHAANALTGVCFGGVELRRAVALDGHMELATPALKVRWSETSVATASLLLFARVSADCPEGRQALLNAGVLPGLVELLSSYTDLRGERAAWTLRNIAWGDHACKQAIADTEGAIAGLGRLMESANFVVREHAAMALAGICHGGVELRRTVAREGHLEHVKQNLSWTEEEASMVVNPSALLCAKVAEQCPEGRYALLDADVLPELVKLLASCNGLRVTKAARALHHVARGDDACKYAIVDTQGAVAALGRVVTTAEGQEANHASHALAAICCGSTELQSALVRENWINFASSYRTLTSDTASRDCWAATLWVILARNGATDYLAIAKAGLLPRLVECLSYCSGCEQRYAAQSVCNLSHGHRVVKKALLRAGVLPAIAKLMRSEPGKHEELAVSTLIGLARGGRQLRKAIARSDARDILLELLSSAVFSLRRNAALLCQLLASSSRIAMQALVQGNIVPKLVMMAQSDDLAEMTAANSALKAMAWGDRTHFWLPMTSEEMGVIWGRLTTGTDAEAARATSIVLLMAACGQEQARCIVQSSLLPSVISCMALPSTTAARNAEQAIGILARGPAAHKQALMQAGLLDVLADRIGLATSHASILKACSMIRILASRELVERPVFQESLMPGMVHALGLSNCSVRGSALDAIHEICVVSRTGCDLAVRVGVVPALVHPMQLEGATQDHMKHALGVLLQELGQCDTAIDQTVASRELLLEVVKASAGTDADVQELACLCLSCCLMGPDECKRAVCDAGGLKPVVECLGSKEGLIASKLRSSLEATARASEEFGLLVQAAGFE